MNRIAVLLVLFVCIAGCQSTTPNYDPFIGRTTVPPPATGSIVGSSPNSYYYNNQGNGNARYGAPVSGLKPPASAANASLAPGWTPMNGTATNGISGTTSGGIANTTPNTTLNSSPATFGNPTSNASGVSNAANAPPGFGGSNNPSGSFTPNRSALPGSNTITPNATPGISPSSTMNPSYPISTPSGPTTNIPGNLQQNGTTPTNPFMTPATPSTTSPSISPSGTPAPSGGNYYLPPPSTNGTPNNNNYNGMNRTGATGGAYSANDGRNTARSTTPFFGGGTPNRNTLPTTPGSPRPEDETARNAASPSGLNGSTIPSYATPNYAGGTTTPPNNYVTPQSYNSFTPIAVSSTNPTTCSTPTANAIPGTNGLTPMPDPVASGNTMSGGNAAAPQLLSNYAGPPGNVATTQANYLTSATSRRYPVGTAAADFPAKTLAPVTTIPAAASPSYVTGGATAPAVMVVPSGGENTVWESVDDGGEAASDDSMIPDYSPSDD